MKSKTSHRSIDLLAAVAIPIAIAPFGYLFGSLFVVHLVPSEARAIWLSTVLLISLTFVARALLFRSETSKR